MKAQQRATHAGITPDVRYDGHADRTYRPSWSANPGFVDDGHRTVFERTKDLPGWQMEADSCKLYEMAYFAGDVILEIGVFGGRSAVVEIEGALANPARHHKPQFYGIDTERAAIARSYTTLDAAGVAAYALLYHGTLQSFAKKFPIRPTMVFVDGDHAYEGVKRDLETLSDLLLPGVPVLCHDYSNPENKTGDYGIRRAADEWAAAGYAEFAGCFGCAALFVTTQRCRGSYSVLTEAIFAEERRELLIHAGVLPADPPPPPDPRITALESEVAEWQARHQARDAEWRARYDARDAEWRERCEAQNQVIKNLEGRVAILLTGRAALRRLGAIAARKLRVYGFLKRIAERAPSDAAGSR